jgi:hypothetical protein
MDCKCIYISELFSFVLLALEFVDLYLHIPYPFAWDGYMYDVQHNIISLWGSLHCGCEMCLSFRDEQGLQTFGNKCKL